MSDLEGIRAESLGWPRKAAGSQKVRCSVCGADGYPGGLWVEAHAEHKHCDVCGRDFATRHKCAGPPLPHISWRAT